MGYEYERPTAIGLPRDAFRPSPIFLVTLVLFFATGAMTWAQVGNVRLNIFLFVIAGWIVTLCLHEYAHALVAFRHGDHGVALRGYLRLDPLKYSNPLFSIVIPVLFILIGGIALPGGAVLIDHSRLRSKAARSAVSLAGPAVNAIFAVVLMIPFLFGVADNIYTGRATHGYFWAALALLAFFQVMAAILNLLPVPGLDGGNAVYPWLSPEWKRIFDMIRPWGIFVVFLIVYYSVAQVWFRDLINAILSGFRVPDLLPQVGLALFQFWK